MTMKVKFNEATRDNPLNYFEDFFSVHGQRKAKIAFLSDILPRIEQLYYEYGDDIDYGSLEYDLEKVVFEEYFSGIDSETGEHVEDIQEHKYLDYLKNVLVNPESAKFHSLLRQRIDGCDGLEQEIYVLNKMLNKLDKMAIFLDQHEDVPFRDRLKIFVRNVRKKIEDLMPNDSSGNDKIQSEKKKESKGLGVQRETDRLSDLQPYIPLEALMEFLKKEEFIKCSKPEIAKFNYYFGIGKGTNRPPSKIKWLKDPELLKLLIKRGFNGGPKFKTFARIFEVDGLSEEDIINWTNRNVNKIVDKALRLKLEKFLEKHSTETKKNIKQNKTSEDVLLT